jgi:hypothetical protein
VEEHFVCKQCVPKYKDNGDKFITLYNGELHNLQSIPKILKLLKKNGDGICNAHGGIKIDYGNQIGKSNGKTHAEVLV